MKRVYVGESAIHRRGMIASRDIPKGGFVVFIQGPMRHLLVKNKRQSLGHPNWIGISKHTWIDPKPPCKYLNHSCNPTAGVRGRIKIYALRAIKKGEEVTVDYSIIEPNLLWEMRCNCGAKNCRKIIRSIQSLPRAVYTSYTPYVPTYFQKLYARAHSGSHARKK